MDASIVSPRPALPQHALEADCSLCQGLCCAALSFERGEWFRFDKPAGVACRHLTSGERCSIHTSLEQRGFAGCAAYDCYGAGQRVTQELFAGSSWRDDPQLACAMFEVFSQLRQLHELLLLQEAQKLPLPPAHEAERDRLLHRVAELERSAGDAMPSAVDGAEGEVLAFLKTLSNYVERPARKRRLRLVRSE